MPCFDALESCHILKHYCQLNESTVEHFSNAPPEISDKKNYRKLYDTFIVKNDNEKA